MLREHHSDKTAGTRTNDQVEERLYFEVVFKRLFDKGAVYKGYKVMPYSTALATPLSNFEATQNYKDVQDPAVVVTFPLLDDPNTCLLAW